MVKRMRVATAAISLVAAIAFGQQAQQTQQQNATPQAAPATTPRPAGAGRGTDGTRAFLGLGVKPDAEAAQRGAPVYASNCGFCHGPTARGAEGPSLLTSDVVLGDDHGEKMVPFLKLGRPGRGMPSFDQLPEDKLKDVTEFLHQQVENYANRGDYKVANILVGDAGQGKIYFDAKCSSCHSVSGDLAHVGSKYKPVDLQRAWISPRRDGASRSVTATVTGSDGTISGALTQLDDFHVRVTDATGKTHDVPRGPAVKIALKDPLEYHMRMIPGLKDDDIHDMTAYLEKQK